MYFFALLLTRPNLTRSNSFDEKIIMTENNLVSVMMIFSSKLFVLLSFFHHCHFRPHQFQLNRNESEEVVRSQKNTFESTISGVGVINKRFSDMQNSNVFFVSYSLVLVVNACR